MPYQRFTIRDVIVFFISFFLTISSVAGFFHFGNLYYIMLFAIALLSFLQGRIDYHIGMPLIAFFILACILSLVVNDVPAFFNSRNRLLVYILVLLVVSPLVTGSFLGRLRSQVLFFSLYVLSVLSFGSFIGYFFNINLFVRNDTELEIGAGTFSGLMNHSMVLGPFAAISAIFLFSCFLSETKRQQKLLYLLWSIGCMAASLLAASRIAIAGGIAGLVLVIMRYYKDRMSRAFSTILIIVLISVASFPIWGNFADFVVAKQLNNIEQGEGNAMYSRQRKAAARIIEFTSSPIFGIGFCSVNPRLDVAKIENGQIEPGSSWLAIASMTGILGLLSFIPICIISFFQAWRIRNRRIACILSAILLFFLIHMIAEGYIMAPRSYLNMMFWLVLGVINATTDSDS